MDLSKVLGDVYDTDDAAASPTFAAPAPAPAPAPRAATAPEWADEDRLDRAFASWTPGPPADAPAAEREYAAAANAGSARARLDELLAATEAVTPGTAAFDLAPAAPAAYPDTFDLAPTAYDALVADDAPPAASPVYAAAPPAATPVYAAAPLPPPPPATPVYATAPPPPAPAPVAVYGHSRQWARGDDDVLATGGGSKRRALRRR